MDNPRAPRRRAAWKWLVLGLAAPLLAWQGASLLQSGHPSPVTNPNDFRSFYCAGRLLLQGRDPYMTEPLRTCEHDAARGVGLRIPPGVIDPAPLPPYALAAFGPLGLLPFALASGIWFGLLLAGVAACVILLRRLTGLPYTGIAACVVFSLGFTALALGQFVALVAALLCAGALCLRQGRAGAAAVAASVTMLEPHLGLPVVISLFVWKPSARVPLLVCGALALVATLAIAGPARSIEYATQVLPLHALSEVDKLYLQYSATSVLWAAGLGPSAALRAGTLWYACMVAAGIVLARRCAVATGDEAFLVVLPPVLAAFGGTFVHVWQIAVAIPAGLLAFVRFPRMRPLLAVAIAILAFPPQTLLEVSGLVRPFNLALSASASASAPQPQWRAAEGRMAAAHAANETPESEPAEIAEMRNDRDGALARPRGAQLLGYLPKALTWFALLALIAAAVAGGMKPPVAGRLRAFRIPVTPPARP